MDTKENKVIISREKIYKIYNEKKMLKLMGNEKNRITAKNEAKSLGLYRKYSK